ncbi:MAG: adenylate kinase [Candidatus Limnocylindria bacterium]
MRGELIFMGPPGSGKGTQARLLADRYGWAQLATGDLFRDHTRRGTELGRLADRYMSKGAYVPDDLTVRMVRERLQEIPSDRRVLLDGFPRTVEQARALDGLLAEFDRSVGSVILIDVPQAELVDRLAGRATCASCQAVYSLVKRPPRVAGVCDRCGGPVASTARADDSPEVVARRFDVYEELTRPVIEHYRERGLLRPIDGTGEPDEITRRIVEAIA